MAAGDGVGSMPSQIFEVTRERLMGNHLSNEKDTAIGVEDGMQRLDHQNYIGNLQISVVEGRNFEAQGDGQTFRPSVELQIGEQKVRTDTLKDTLSPSWLADFSLAVPSEDSQLWVSVINSDLLLDDESLVGRAAISVHDLLCSGTRVQWIHMKNPTNKTVGEICLVLRYSNYQASSSSAAASSETRDDNQYGLKALLCQCPPHSTSSNLRCNSDDALNNIAHCDLSSSILQEALEDKAGAILQTGKKLTAEVLPTGPSTLESPVLEVKSLFDESEESCKNKSEISGGGSKPCGQNKKVAFLGAFMAILAAMAWGSKFSRKRIEDEEKVIHYSSLNLQRV